MRDMLQRFRTATLVGDKVDLLLPAVDSVTVDLLASGLAGPETATVDSNIVVLQGFAEGRTVFHVPEAGASDNAAPTRVGVGAETPAVSDLATVTDLQAAMLSAALYRRFGVEHLPGQSPLATRHALILQRLCVVRDTCAVLIAGHDRSLRITMANGRVMKAIFELPGRRKRIIPFPKAQVSKAVTREVAVLLAELCAGSVDLYITEAPASGVFDGAAGVVVTDLVTAAGLGPFGAPLPEALPKVLN